MSASTSMWEFTSQLAAGIVLWSVASVPAYWFLGAWIGLRSAIRGALSGLVAMFRDLRERRRGRRVATTQELRSRLQLTTVDDSLVQAWTQSLVSAFESIQAGSRQMEQAQVLATSALNRIEPQGRRLERLQLMSETVPELPTVDQALLRAKRNRLAVVNLILAVVILIPIAAVNAQLTGLVLSEFIPPVQPVLGIPVPFVLAVVLVIAEAGIGLLHSAEAERTSESERRLTAGLLIWSLAGIGVVALETVLYSQVNGGQLSRETPLGGSAFGLMGAILGASVFGLGRLAHTSLSTIRKDRTPRAVARQLVRLRKAADDWNSSAERLRPAQASASEGCAQLMIGYRQLRDAERVSLESFRLEVNRSKEFPPAWAKPFGRTLTDSEFSERESAAYLWSVVAALSTLSLVGLVWGFASRISVTPAVALGVGAGVLAYSTGALAAAIKTSRLLLRASGYILLWIVMAGAVLLVGRVLRGQINLYTWLFLVPATAAYIAGLRTGGAIALLQLPAIWLIDVVAYGACALASALLWSLSALTAVIEYAARLVAWPATLLTDAWRTRSRGRSASVASV
jgi:hypothetical protein